MDVFHINGSSLSMSSRPPATIGKPPVFQKPHKPKPTTKMSKLPVKKPAFKAGSNIKQLDRQNHPRTITKEETNLLVKLPSVESDDYKSPSSSSSNESSEDSDNEEGEVDSEPEDREGQTSRAILSENEDDGRFSGANSPWFESQDHDETTLSELVQNAQVIDIEEAEDDVKVDIEEIQGKLNFPPEAPPEEEAESLEPEKIDDEGDDVEVEEEPRQQPLSMKNGRLHRSKTPETMVQLIDDIESSESNDDKEDEDEVKEAEINEELPPKINSPQAEPETEPEKPEEPSVLEKAKAGNEKRMARFLQDGEFYDTYPIKKGGSTEDQRSMSASTVTLPSPVSAFTPELANEEYTGGYNDILNVLERLEDETAKEGQEDSSEDKDSGRPQSESSSATASPKRTSTSSSSANTVGPGHPHRAASRASPSKMSDLMNYLESVENDKESGSESGGQSSNGTAMPILNRSPMNSKIAELACESPKKLAEQVVNLQFTVEEKERAIEVLRQAIDHQRKLSANFSQKFQKELNQRLAAQKTEYEATIMRHQNFIDQLIEDKKALAERCDALKEELANGERKYQEALKGQEQRHNSEIRRLKSLQETSNKLKQEKWVDEKTRRIKEQTVRGLEPEIQRLLARHNAELADLEAERERRLGAQERELHARHLQHIRELRAQWEEENAEGWIHERQLLTQRHNQQLEEVIGGHREELERLQEQLRRERQRCTDDRAHYENEANQIRRISTERAQAEIDRIREEEEAKRKVLMKKHANEMVALKETEATERADWERKCRQKMDEEWKQQEESIREKFRKERDTELDRVVHKLEAEVISGRKELEVEFHERMSRMRGKFETEIAELTRELDTMRDKWSKSRDEAAKREEELIVVKALLKTKEVALHGAQETNAKFEAEKSNVRQAVRGEFCMALDSLASEKSGLMNQLSEVRLKLAELQSEHEAAEKQWKVRADEEATKIHARVKAAIHKKDEVICELQRNYDQALAECQHLETLLQRQTKNNYLNQSKPPGRK